MSTQSNAPDQPGRPDDVPTATDPVTTSVASNGSCVSRHCIRLPKGIDWQSSTPGSSIIRKIIHDCAQEYVASRPGLSVADVTVVLSPEEADAMSKSQDIQTMLADFDKWQYPATILPCGLPLSLYGLTIELE